MKKILAVLLALTLLGGTAIKAEAAKEKKVNYAAEFFEEIKKHCGNAYEGTATEGGDEPPFNQRLVMHVRECTKNQIKIPFFVGEDKSRTWVLTLKKDRILLKHDHRHEDGSSDEVTMYGGLSTNTGSKERQMFPADQETADLIPYAAWNVWWMTVTDQIFSYNLRRIGTPRLFTVEFDLTKKLEETPSAPWGHE
ncbi:hypothetical protein Dip518_001013 [Parelusimicrobium proximum]|uniref:hypothetical protein n=1 Tax=Parelusimicrobium proximum TaxID=3228953 RepID=UPI003D17F39C